MIVNNKYRFVFVHIPKNAGTSFRSALSQLDGEDRTAVGSSWHETYSEFRSKYQARTGNPSSTLDDYLVFAIVRNPIDRFVSLHRYLLKTHRHIYPLVPNSINRFVDLVADRPGWTDSIRSLRPQNEYLDGANALIGRFENLDDGFCKLCSTLNVSLQLRHLNSSSDESGKFSLRSAAKTIKQLAGKIKRRNLTLKSYSEPLNSLSKSKLALMYSKDIETFGY